MADYDVFVIEGDFRDFSDPDLPYIKFDGLCWEQATTLSHISLGHGFQVAIRFQAGGEENAEAESRKEL